MRIRNVMILMVAGIIIGIWSIAFINCQAIMPAATAAKAISDMTPKEKSAWMLGLYNSKYADHRTQTGWQVDSSGNWVKVRNPELSKERQELLQQEKDLLKRLFPLIKVYDGYVERGVIPSQDTEQQIMDIINRLESM